MPASSPALSGTRPERGPALLTIAQVADHLGASTRHVRRLVDRGQLPVHRLGRLVRISEDDLRQLIAASRQAGR